MNLANALSRNEAGVSFHSASRCPRNAQTGGNSPKMVLGKHDPRSERETPSWSIHRAVLRRYQMPTLQRVVFGGPRVGWCAYSINQWNVGMIPPRGKAYPTTTRTRCFLGVANTVRLTSCFARMSRRSGRRPIFRSSPTANMAAIKEVPP